MRRVIVLQLQVHDEHDVVQARRRARQIAELLGFEVQDRTRIATALSEIARNALLYAGRGQIEFTLEGDPVNWLEMTISDQGPGIANLQEILSGHYRSPTGLGMGLLGSKRLMDDFRIHTSPQGTVVVLRRQMRRPGALADGTGLRVADIAAALARIPSATPLEEVKQQNRELLSTLETLRRRERQLEDLNRELEETNRGMVALYAELDEKAESLRRAHDVKTRFMADMTHEFRTPLNSILSVSQMLLDQFDGPLAEAQVRQVDLVRTSAKNLSDLVNDLLDIARVEAGKVRVRTQSFSVTDLFGTLRGMLRPLVVANHAVSLSFEEEHLLELPLLNTDEGKVSQILRNVIANALKYTDHGWVRISARMTGSEIVFVVADTGVGINPADQERIFEEFVRVPSPLRVAAKGSGLGLPLARKLAGILGGRVWVESEPGQGSQFYVAIPGDYQGPEETPYDWSEAATSPSAPLILVLEEHTESAKAYAHCMKRAGMRGRVVRSISTLRAALALERPDVIVADVVVGGEPVWEVLQEIKTDPISGLAPLLLVSGLDAEQGAKSLGADACFRKPMDCEDLAKNLREFVGCRRPLALTVGADAQMQRRVVASLDRLGYLGVAGDPMMDSIKLIERYRPDLLCLQISTTQEEAFRALMTLRHERPGLALPVVAFGVDDLAPGYRARFERYAVASLEQSSDDDFEAAFARAIGDARALQSLVVRH